jgi:hypothetical protein
MTEIGCIADDYTGGTDVAAGLRRAGLRVALVFGVPTSGQNLPPLRCGSRGHEIPHDFRREGI